MDKAKLKRAVKQTKKKWEGILEALGDGMYEDDFYRAATSSSTCGFCQEYHAGCDYCPFVGPCDEMEERLCDVESRKDWRAAAKRACKFVIREADKMLEGS